MKNTIRTKDQIAGAVFAGLVAIVTLLVRIPIPNGQGYVNLGDGLIMVSSLLFGPLVGGFAGGIGSMLADIFAGYAVYAPFTLLVKGMEGFLVAYLIRRETNQWLALIMAGASMAVGYFITDWILYGIVAALAGFPMNLAQALTGIFIAKLLYPILSKALKNHI